MNNANVLLAPDETNKGGVTYSGKWKDMLG